MIKMNTFDNIYTRRSVKKYSSREVEKEKLKKIAEAGTYAPTGRNLQSPIIIVITNREIRDKMSKLNAKIMGMTEDFDPFYGAPALMVVLADKSVSTHIYDGSLVMGNLLAAAHEEGLGACWIHRAREAFELPEGKEILKSLGIEGEYEGIGNCVIGYFDGEAPAMKPRKDKYIYYID